MSRLSRFTPPSVSAALATPLRAQRIARLQIALRDRLTFALRGYATWEQCDGLAFFTLTEGGRLISDGYPGPGAQIPPHLRPLLARRYSLTLERLPDGSTKRGPE